MWELHEVCAFTLFPCSFSVLSKLLCCAVDWILVMELSCMLSHVFFPYF